ncbi:MAG: efflux RND transporter periplasmic adaptor subunit [Planctomycetes bacterium]|nr:efflux RND transporter periplasmic adaptor subunit [Planctomycetota bacterium]
MMRPESNPAARERGGVLLTLLVVLLVVGGAAWGWWTYGRQPTVAAIDQDRVVTVQRQELIDAVTASGRVEPLARVAVMSRASGILEKILVDEGDVVVRDQVLAELDREQLLANLAQDQADLASAEARVAASKARVDEAQVKLDDPDLAFAQREVDRLESLFPSGDVSENELDAARQTLATVKFRIAQVNANLPVLRASVQEAEANLASARAALDRSETALREATIRSPIDGVVLLRSKEVGDGVSSLLTAGGNATQILTLGDLQEMYIEARVDEVDLGRIVVDMPVRVTVDAHRGQTLYGRVSRIAPAGSVDNNGIVTFEVRISVDDPQGLLKPDMTADAKLVVSERPDALVLPQRALARGKDGWKVLKIVSSPTGPAVQDVKVELGLSDGLVTEIASGLDEGDQVLLPAGPGGAAGFGPGGGARRAP